MRHREGRQETMFIRDLRLGDCVSVGDPPDETSITLKGVKPNVKAEFMVEHKAMRSFKTLHCNQFKQLQFQSGSNIIGIRLFECPGRRARIGIEAPRTMKVRYRHEVEKENSKSTPANRP